MSGNRPSSEAEMAAIASEGPVVRFEDKLRERADLEVEVPATVVISITERDAIADAIEALRDLVAVVDAVVDPPSEHSNAVHPAVDALARLDAV